MQKTSILALILVLGLFSSCGLLNKDPQKSATVKRQLDTIEISQQKAYLKQPYQPAQPRPMDLVHTKLRLDPIWETASLKGEATLTITPTFYPQDSVVIDAHNFVFHSIRLKEKTGNNNELSYHYDSQHLVVQFPKTLKAQDTLKLFLDYTARLSNLEKDKSAVAGSKGMYFINPKGKIPEKPKQIWTQGETEYSSHWFPTFDQPNVKTTQEVYLTVDTAYTAISNGEKVYDATNADGTHTVYWRQSKPHAPYLFMLAVGKYVKVQDSWQDSIPVNYYVEPQYKQYAQMIFGATPEMMDYYSRILDFDYPWAKYAQVPVRDFIAGAMENTSATIHFSGIQHNKRQHLHRTYETLIAHELIHHWFGDLVTCESWANLAMNEAFATYGEHLWMRHSHGEEAAAIQWQNDLNRYLNESRRKKRPLIQYHYKAPGRLFDAHRYQKGACILRMLHAELGSKAFFKGLSYFLKQHAYQPVEHHDLRLALEHVTGRSLKWFFDQWFRSAGHPKLMVDQHYDSANDEVLLTVKQQQNTNKYPVFKLPMAIDVHHKNGEVKRHQIIINEKADSFYFPAKQPPHLVNFDAEKVILAEKNLRFGLDAWIYQFNNTESYLNQYEAITHISDSLGALTYSKAEALTKKALNSSYRRIRLEGLNMVRDTSHPRLSANFANKVKSLAKNDPETRVRGFAYQTLADYDYANKFLGTFKDGLQDSAYYVVRQALDALKATNPKLALKASKELTDTRSDRLLYVVAKLHAKQGTQEADSFLQHALMDKPNWDARFDLLPFYMKYLERMGPMYFSQNLSNLKELRKWVAGKKDRKKVLKVFRAHRRKHEEALANLKEKKSKPSGQIESHERIISELNQLIKKFRS